MKRREFLKLMGLGGVGLFTLPGALAAMAAGSQSKLKPKLIVDGRYPSAMGYAERLHQHGIPSLDTQGDLVGLWYRDADAFRMRSGQVMLGYTTWSDYQSLRILLDDARLGRDPRLGQQGNNVRLMLLQQDRDLAWPETIAGLLPATSDRENGVHLVTWIAFC